MTIRFEATAGGFPSTVFHPVLGARSLKDANEAVGLGPDWFNTAEEADLHRTDTEAQMAIHKNRAVKVSDLEALEEGQHEDDRLTVVRNSVAADASFKQGNAEPL